ncbi:MAG: SAM-dependent methyltransferase [Muribaculaceae bacterium]|nr:SAM-dependent methyltransferase [Muribaculaceae bacterium]
MQLESVLYMIPVPISDGSLRDILPLGNNEIISGIKHFIVENVRTARRFLKKMDPSTDISQIVFYELNGHTPENEIWGYLSPLRDGVPMGVMSEAGCPGVADPGAKVVMIAQNEGLKVVPLVGPSSILLSLMASGLNGQKFSFQGYLPVDPKDREKTIRDLESQSRRYDMTQIFIETPYRNEKMMESLLKNLGGETLLCVAADVTGKEERIITKPVRRWKEEGFKIEKVPTIFLFYSIGSRK